MKKITFFCLALLITFVSAWAQVPYYGTPFHKQGFDVATLSSTGWEQEGTLYASSGNNPTTTAWSTLADGSIFPPLKRFSVADPASTYSLQGNIDANNGLVGTVTSPVITNTQSNVIVGFSLFNPIAPAIFPAGYGYLAFQISKDNGTTWNDLWRTDGQATEFSYTETSLNEAGVMAFTGWYGIQVNLPSSYDNTNFKLRFYVNSPTLRTTAVQFLIDGVFASKRRVNDARINFVNNFATGTALNDKAYFNTPITVNFSNMGSAPIYSIDLQYSVTPGNQTVTETFYLPEPLVSDASADYTFSTLANLSGLRTTYSLQVQTALAGDEYAANDKLSFTIKNTMTAVPYTAAWLRNSSDDNYDCWKFIQGQSPLQINTIYPFWTTSTNATDTMISCDASTKSVDADAYAYSRPMMLYTGKRYELTFSAITNSTNSDDKNTLQVFLAKQTDSLSREGQPLFYRDDINNAGYLNQKLIITPEKDTSYHVVFRALSAARSKQLCVYKVSVREVADVDAGVTLLSPQDLMPRYSNAETIKIQIKNVGLQPIVGSTIRAYYQLDGGEIVEEMFPVTLTANESMEHAFGTTVDLTALRSYELKTWIVLADDGVQANDTVSTTRTPKTTNLPYNASLGTSMSDRTGEEKYWEAYTWTISALGTYVRWGLIGSTYSPQTATGTLYSRPIAIKAGQICEYTYQVARSAAQSASMDVKIYTKSGNTFTLVKDVRSIDITTGNNVFTTYTETFTPTVDGDYYFAFITVPPSGGLKCTVFLTGLNFYQIYMTDLSLEKLLFPGTQVAGLDSLPVGAMVKNNGKNAISTCAISYQVDNGTTVTEEIGALASGVQKIHYFNQKAVFAGTGTESLKVWGTLAGDEYAGDDTLKVNIQNVEKAAIPYNITDFSTVNDWLAFDQNKDAVTWQKLADGTGFTYNATSSANDYLMTKQMNLQAGKTYRISFEALASAANKPFNVSLMYGKGNQVENLALIKDYTGIIETTAGRPNIAYVSISETGGYVVAFRVNGTTNAATIANSFSVTEVAGLPNAEMQIAYPVSDGVFSITDSIVLNIKNVGQDIIQQFPITCKLNGTVVENSMFYETIGVNQTYQFVIRNLDMMIPQAYNIEAYTNVVFDPNNANDTARVSVNCLPFTDMQMTNIIDPISGRTNTAAQVKVTVQNVGNVAVSNFPVSYQVNGNTVTETVSASVAPLASYDYTFTQTANLETAGSYNLKAYVSASDDGNHGNDTLSTVIYTTNQAIDVAMLAITSPVDGILTNAETITVSVKNNSNIPLTVPVFCTVDGTQTLSGSVDIPASSTVSYSFTDKVNMSQVKTYHLVAYTALPNDELPANDQIVKEVSYIKKDLGVSRIVSPTMRFQCTNATPIVVEIRNYGVNAITSTPVSYKINNGTVITETAVFSPYLAPGAAAEYTFVQNSDLSQAIDYSIVAYTTLGGDVNRANDTARVIIKLGYGDAALPVMVSDGTHSSGGQKSHVLADGSLFVKFWQARDNGRYDLYAQLLNQSGTPQFAAEGIKISNNERTYSIVNASEVDKEGNLIMGYSNISDFSAQNPEASTEVRVSKLSRSGEHLFGPNGVVVIPKTTAITAATFVRTDSRSYIYVATTNGKLFKIDKTTGAIIKSINRSVSTMEFDNQDRLYVTYSGTGSSLLMQVYDTDLNPILSTPAQIADAGADGATIILFDTENAIETGVWVCYSSYSYANTYFVQFLDNNLAPQIGAKGVPVSNAASRHRLYGWPAVVRGTENTLAFAFAETVTGGTVYNYVKGQIISKTGDLKWGSAGKDLFPPSYQAELGTMGLVAHNDTLYLSHHYYPGSGSLLSTNVDVALFDKEFNSKITAVNYATSIYDATSFSYVPNDYGIFMSWVIHPNIGGYTIGTANAQHFYFDKTLQNKQYSVTVESDNYDMGYAVGGGLFDLNGKAIMKATPVPGYRLKAWKKGATTVSTANPYIFNVTANTAITAVFEPDVYTITATASAGGSITPSGVVEVTLGNSKTFSILPNIGYKTSQVLVDGVNVPEAVTSGYYTFSNVTANHTIEARFEIIKFNITASASVGGIINPTGNIAVNYGADRTFTFTANLGYELKEVLVDGENQPDAVTNGSYTFTHIIADHTIVANFERIKFVITATAGENGSITPSGEVDVFYGNNQTFTITPDEGYAIQSVLVDGVNVPTAVNVGTYTFTNVRAAHTIEATFAQAQYTITATADANGSITPSGVIGVTSGSSRTFFIVPNAGYKISQVLVDGAPNPQALSGSYTFYNISASHTISATFEHSYSTITATAGEGGKIAPAGTTQVVYNGNQFYTITPNFGYKIATVLVDGTNNAAAVENGSYLFANVTSDHSIAATFERLPHTIVSEATAGGSISPSGSTQVADGGSQTYTITVKEGYTLTKVLVDGTNNETAVAAKTYTFSNVTENHTIRAIFEISKYTIEATAGEGGTIMPTGTIIVNYGGSKTYTFTPNAGYVIDKVLIDGTNNETAVTEGTYSFEDVKDNHTIEVSFKITTVTITSKVEGGNGTIDPSGETDVDYGASQMYTFTPNEGYDIAEVLVDGVSKPGAVQNGRYTFNNVTTNHEIVVKFSEKTAIDEGGMATLKVYPNPTTGQLRVTNYELKIKTVVVFDITGRLVLEVNNVDHNETTIDLSNYSDGVYFIKVDGKTVKVVKR